MKHYTDASNVSIHWWLGCLLNNIRQKRESLKKLHDQLPPGFLFVSHSLKLKQLLKTYIKLTIKTC